MTVPLCTAEITVCIYIQGVSKVPGRLWRANFDKGGSIWPGTFDTPCMYLCMMCVCYC